MGCTAAYDDAVAESFFGSLTKDLLGRKSFCIRAARAAVFDYIETCYNAIRLHSTLGYLKAGRVGEDQRRKTANYALSTEAGTVASTALWTYSPADAAPLPSGLVGEGRALVPFAVAGAPTRPALETAELLDIDVDEPARPRAPVQRDVVEGNRQLPHAVCGASVLSLQHVFGQKRSVLTTHANDERPLHLRRYARFATP